MKKNLQLLLMPHKSERSLSLVMAFLFSSAFVFALLFSAEFALRETTFVKKNPSITIELTVRDGLRPGIAKKTCDLLGRLPHVSRFELVDWRHMEKLMVQFERPLKEDVPYPVLIHVWSPLEPYILLSELKSVLDSLEVAPNFLLHPQPPHLVRVWQNARQFLWSSSLLFSLVTSLGMFVFLLSAYLKLYTSPLKLLVTMGAGPQYIRTQLLNRFKHLIKKSLLYTLSFSVPSFWLFHILLDTWEITSKISFPTLFESFATLMCCAIFTIYGISYALIFLRIRTISQKPMAASD